MYLDQQPTIEIPFRYGCVEIKLERGDVGSMSQRNELCCSGVDLRLGQLRTFMPIRLNSSYRNQHSSVGDVQGLKSGPGYDVHASQIDRLCQKGDTNRPGIDKV